MTGEKFSLNWKDFSATSTERFRPLIREAKFSDVTLVCGDGQRIPGHQVILATGCTLFKSLLEGEEANSKPLIFLRGVEADLLLPLLHFLYTGKAQLAEELLANFVTLAEDLGVEGLANNFNSVQNYSRLEESESENTEYFDVEDQNTTLASKEVVNTEINPTNIDIPCYVCSERFDDQSTLEKHTKSHKHSQEKVSDSGGKYMIPSVQNIIVPKKDEDGFHKCNFCERKILDLSNFRRHVQASHLRISLKCNQCDFSTRHEGHLSVHKKKHVKIF